MKYFYKPVFVLLGIMTFALKSSGQTYCQSVAGGLTDSDITRVVLNTLDVNSESFPCSQYSHYTAKTTSLDIGSTYSMSITLGVHATCGGDFYDKSARAWIDFNGDGDFDDAGELLGATQYTFGTFTSTFSFTVPCTAIAGVKRMRVVCQEASPNAITPCNTYYYGETEDYNVTLLAGPAANADFTIPDTVYTDWVAQFTNINQSGFTHQWYNSDDDINLGTLGSTSTNYTHTFANPGCYTVRLVSTNCQGSAIKNKQVCVIDPTSLPVPNFVVSTNIFYFTGDPIDIQFHDLSMFGPNYWEWNITPDIGSGAAWFWSNGSEFSQNPSAFFYDTGTYEVCLTVSNSLGVSVPLCKSAYITITPPTGLNPINLLGKDFKGKLSTGYIYDSGGETGNYASNEYYQFTIEPCGASSVTLNFEEFTTEAGNDVLNIYDGPNSTFPMLGSYSGTNIPSSITANSGKMTLEFQSTPNTNLSGFKAYWTSVIPSNGQATANFLIADTVYECASGTEITALNNSTGAVAGQAEYEWIMDYDSLVTYPKGYCEICDEENANWTYTPTGTVQDYLIRLVMKTCEGNDTIVKKLIVSPTLSLPSIDFTASNRRVSTGSIVMLSEISVANCSRVWEIMPANGWSLVSGNQLSDKEINVLFNNAGSYHITLKGTNDNGVTQEVKTNYIDVIDYCTPSVGIPTISDIGITRVKLNTISNTTSTGTSPGYTDYTKTNSTTLIAGNTYRLVVNRKSNKVNKMNRKAWIDFNRDGIFDESTERVLFEASSMTDSFASIFTVPNNLTMVEGNSKLRVSVALDNTNNTPCGPLSVGEYEDYGIVLAHDDLPPVLSLIGLDTVFMEINTSYNEAGALAMDNIEGNISNRIKRTGFIDSAQAGHYILTYNIQDASGLNAVSIKRHVFVLNDITAPVITLNGNNPMVHPVYLSFTDPSFVVTDNPGNITLANNLVQVNSNVNIELLGDYSISYKVSDTYGNSSLVTRIVQVRDMDAPVITSPANVFWQVGVPFTNPVILKDNYDLTVQLKQTGFINTSVFGSYTIQFGATDASGNTSIPVQVTYTVGDSIKPTFKTAANSDIIYVKVNDVNFKESKVEAIDNYYPAVQLDRDASALDIFVLGTYPIIYTATDASGNMATYTRMVNVIDDEIPIVNANPLNIERWSSFDPLSGVVVSDNYNTPDWFVVNNKIQIMTNNVDVNYPGIYQVVYRAIDESGNASNLTSRYVRVKETSSTGIIEQLNESNISVYPNPSSGIFNIEVDFELPLSDISVKIFNSSGKELDQSYSITSVRSTIDLSAFSKGIYLLQIETNRGVVVKRIIIQ